MGTKGNSAVIVASESPDPVSLRLLWVEGFLSTWFCDWYIRNTWVALELVTFFVTKDDISQIWCHTSKEFEVHLAPSFYKRRNGVLGRPSNLPCYSKIIKQVSRLMMANYRLFPKMVRCVYWKSLTCMLKQPHDRCPNGKQGPWQHF